ncbi:MAG: DNA-binding protein WhiA, partial [Oscillospiraceae bacterium]
NSISFGFFHNYCCQVSFLRGAYCIIGTTINPKKEYHFEFSLSNAKICSQMYIVISQMSDDSLEIKQTRRNNFFVLYIKDSQQIEDILVYLGATQCSMDLMNTKIEKQLRNSVNRRTNCETANIDKTVNASVLQTRKINHIIKAKGIDFLRPELKEAAILRLENPDMSLTELCQVANFEISRSGLNHRLKKICDLSDSIETTD